MYRRRVAPGAIAAAAYAVLLFVWAMTTPPWAVPDEPAQQVKAVALAHGQIGAVPHYSEPPRSFYETWFRSLTRIERIDSRTVPPEMLPCMAFEPTHSAACLDNPAARSPWNLDAAGRLSYAGDPSAKGELVAMIARLDVVERPDGRDEVATTSYFGTYQPFVYLIPGIAASAGSTPTRSLYLGRMACVVLCAALIGAGIILSARHSSDAGLLAPLVAITPMALFVGGSLSASGIEIAAGFCFASCLAVFVRGGAARTKWASTALVGSAGLLICARAFGPAWVLLALGFTLVSAGPRATLDAIRARKATAIALAVVVVIGGAANLWWSLVVQPRPPPRPNSFTSNVHAAIGDLTSQYRQLIGVFGWLDTNLPGAAYLAWTAVVLVLLLLALLVGSRRDRVITMASVVALIVVTVLVSAGVAAPVGTSAQGRWVLPVAVMIPVLLSTQWSTRRSRIGAAQPKKLTVWVGVTVAAVHLVALWASARRYAVGVDGPALFLGRSEWSPPMGWLPWLTLGVLACGALVLAAIASARSPAVDVAVE